MKVLIFAVLISFASALEEDIVKELKCNDISPPESLGLDLKWFDSVKQFYLPLWNQLYATRTASDVLLRHARFIAYEEVQPSSCLIFHKDNTIEAFGHKAKYNITGDATSIMFKSPWAGAKSGQFNFHLTDNKNFILGITCWEDNEASWAVISAEPFLDTRTRSKILNYVKSMGFDVNKAIDENYWYCGHQSTPIRLQSILHTQAPQHHYVYSPYYY